MQDAQSAGRTLLVAWAHLAVLWSFAFVQPLLDVLGDAPEFFVARGNTRADIIILALLTAFVPPTLLVGVEALLVRAPRVRHAFHLALVAGLAAVIVLQAVEELAPGSSAAVAIAISAVAGVLGAAIYARIAGIRSFLTALTPAPVVFVAIFLLISPTSELVLPQDSVSAEGGSGGSGAPVVMVVLDELSGSSLLDERLRIDRERLPGFAALAAQSTWYRNATTVDYATPRAVPAILTGTYPSDSSVPVAADHPRNLFTLLGDRYRLRVSESVTALCPEQLCRRDREPLADRLDSLVDDLSVVSLHLLAPKDLEDGLPDVDATFEGFRSGGADAAKSAGADDASPPAGGPGNRADQFEGFLSGIRNGPTPALDFVHVTLPHVPWQYLPSGQQYPVDVSRIPGLEDQAWVRDRFPALQGYQRYLLQLEYTDRLLERLIARLRRVGLWNRALVVVAADHGVSFHPGRPRRLPTASTLAEIANVPLFVKAPGQERGRMDDSPARTVDILPTIADHLGLRPGWRFGGRSLRGGAPGRDEVSVLAGDRFTAGIPAFERARRAEVTRRTALFGSGADPFALGSDSRLDGLRAAGLPAGRGSGGRVELDNTGLLAEVDPAGRTLPVFLTGRLSGPLEAGARLAVAINGTVRATVTAYADQGELRLSALVPPDSLRKGANEVAVYRVTGAGDDVALSRLGGTVALAGTLDEGGDPPLLRLGGRRIPITEGAVAGFVEKVEALSANSSAIFGWAADPRKRAKVTRVVVFVDGRLAGSVRPSLPRGDLVEPYGPAAITGGYRVVVPVPGSDAAEDPDRVRVFALMGKRASELARTSP